MSAQPLVQDSSAVLQRRCSRAKLACRLRVVRTCRHSLLLVQSSSHSLASICSRRRNATASLLRQASVINTVPWELETRHMFSRPPRQVALDSPWKIAAVATPEQDIEPTEDETSQAEKMRRFRISSANKGRVPWNKGRKHSPETIAKIRERTKLAMQRKDVIEKLKNAPHLRHSRETKAKISRNVRKQKEEKRAKLPPKPKPPPKVKEKPTPPPSEADSATSDSKAPAPPRKARLSEAHRKALSEAIKKKWQDPNYRNKVITSMKASEANAKRPSTANGAADVRPKRSAKRVTASASKRAKGPHASARKIIGLTQQKAQEVISARDEKLNAARRVVIRAEQQLAALRGQMDAFAHDPVKAEQAHQAVHLATQLLTKAKQQLNQAERMQSGTWATTSGGDGQADAGMFDEEDTHKPVGTETYANGFTSTPAANHSVHTNGIVLPNHVTNGMSMPIMTGFSMVPPGSATNGGATNGATNGGYPPYTTGSANGAVKNGKARDTDEAD